MKYCFRIFFLGLFAIAISACSTCKVAKLSSIQEIQFGSGGGFTGSVTTYTIKANGSLAKGNQPIRKISCDSLSSIFEQAELLPHENFVHPDNVYSFVRIITPSETYYYTWSMSKKPDKKVIDLYKKLNMQL